MSVNTYHVSQTLLMKYIKLALAEAHSARVPQQLLQPSEKEQQTDTENGPEEVKEFCGAGAVAGYTAPLGMNPDDVGRKKNRPRRKK